MRILLIPTLLFGLSSGLSAQTTVQVDTDYSGQNFSGQTLTAAASDLGSTNFYNSDLANTSWSSTPTSTPHFSSLGLLSGGAFRFSGFEGASWSGLSFTGASDGIKFFENGRFEGADFSNTTFDFSQATAAINAQDLLAFSNANFSGADFSGSFIDAGLGKKVLNGATFDSSTNFSGATIYSAGGTNVDFAGANFSGATLRVGIYGSNVSGVNFQDANFVNSDGYVSDLRFVVANLTNFRGADFSGARGLSTMTWDGGMAPIYDDNTNFNTTEGTFDPVAAGWTYSPVPESSAFSLIVSGVCALMILRRRR